MCSRKEHEPMSASQERQPTLISIAPRFPVADMEQALAFYAQLGFATTYRDGEFAIVERDGISLHFTVSEGHSVCWIGVTNIEALYQQYVPTGAIQSPLTSQPWGIKPRHGGFTYAGSEDDRCPMHQDGGKSSSVLSRPMLLTPRS